MQWWVWVLGILVSVFFWMLLKFNSRPRATVHSALSKVEAAVIEDFGDQLARFLRTHDLENSATAQNEALAFQWAVIGHAIQAGGGSERIRMQACMILKWRHAISMSELRINDRLQLLSARNQEYGQWLARFNAKPEHIIAATASFSRQPFLAASELNPFAVMALTQHAPSAFSLAKDAWHSSVAQHRLFLDEREVANEFPDGATAAMICDAK